MQDQLGDRMKEYEQAEAGRRLMPLLPVLARIDGRTFSRFTSGLASPYDERFNRLMVATTEYLMHETGALCGYTQSDEISLCWIQPSYISEIFFGGKIQKMTSQCAALATVAFNYHLPTFLPREWADKKPTFDARVWNVPNRTEAANVFLWRELDASKNSMSMLAQHHYSPKELHKKGWGDMHGMLLLKGIDWNTYPEFFKKGTFLRRRKGVRPFTTDEIEKLPAKHEARTNPHLLVERTDLIIGSLPPLINTTNREQVLFEGAETIYEGEHG